MPKYIPLRVATEYSLAESTIKIPDLVSFAEKNNIPAIAVTDSGNLFASLEFSLAAIKKGIQPIIGCNIRLDLNIDEKKQLDQITLIAKNDEGIRNLFKLVSDSFLLEREQKENYITLAELAQYSKGLIVLTAGADGSLARLLKEGRLVEAKEFIEKLKSIFADDLFIEITRHGSTDEKKIEKPILDLAFEHKVPLVATNKTYFLEPKTFEAHDILLCIADGTYVGQNERRRSDKSFYLKSEVEMCKLFADLPEALENSVLIAKKCTGLLLGNKIIFPEYKTNYANTEDEELKILANKGLQEHLEKIKIQENLDLSEFEKKKHLYQERLDYEISVINGMQFPGYFLIVSDFIRWSKANNIPVGPGRGSGAGSLVAWCLSITDVDPIKFGLLFERFLNPERVSMPDFDIDFCQERRDEVIEYVRNKYGHERVAQIITFGKLQARAVIKDVGRAMQMPYSQVDKISKMIPFNPVDPVTLDRAIASVPELKNLAENDEEVSKLIQIALQLEGINRHASTHAAGIVISRQPLVEVAPLYKDHRSAMPAIQYSMKYAESAGLIKFDFLGLKTLTVIQKASELARLKEKDFEISTINYEDKKTYGLLSRGAAVGVFQFESSGMQDSLRKMKPDSIFDIIALGALYRPGPMDNIPTYIAGKHGKQQPDYLHPKLHRILEETFGVIIYQEQVMEIAQVLSGYSLGAADLLRRAMGKKIKEEMDAQRESFVNGAIAQGVLAKDAGFIFDLVAKFAGYGFNKSHATAYGIISYQTAYLKANFPVEMLIASINTEIDDTEKINLFIQEAKSLNIKILAPDINSSEVEFTNQGGMIRYGLGALKNIGLKAMAEIINERKKAGAFQDIFEFFQRIDLKSLNKRMLENLVRSGSFDVLYPNRNELLSAIPTLMEYYSVEQHNKNQSQISLFSMLEPAENRPEIHAIKQWTLDEELENEFLAFGFYPDRHPLEAYKQIFTQLKIADVAHIKETFPEGFSKIKLAAVPISLKTRMSARGRYVSCLMSTYTGILEVSVFDSNLLEQTRDMLFSKDPLYIEGECRKDEGGARVAAHRIMLLSNFLSSIFKAIKIYEPSAKDIESLKGYLLEKSTQTKGIKILIIKEINGKKIQAELPSTYSNINLTTLKNLLSCHIEFC